MNAHFAFGLMGEVYANVSLSPSSSPLMYGWQGLAYDAATKNWDNLARQYDQNTGTFLSQDPIGVEGGVNVYGSRKNNPLTFSDPDGLKYRICSRPLHGSPGQYGPLRHDYIQFDDGTTYSFGPAPGEAFLWGSVISTNLLEDGSTASCSSFSNDSGRDEEIRKRAESNLLKKYNIYNFNCQDFVQDALR